MPGGRALPPPGAGPGPRASALRLRAPRQAGSQSADGAAERCGEDCWVLGYRFCSPE